jgi:hypothetical protein
MDEKRVKKRIIKGIKDTPMLLLLGIVAHGSIVADLFLVCPFVSVNN